MNSKSARNNVHKARVGPVRRRLRPTRRGVAAVLAMMFLILFGSLSAAMAIASRGNITTAATHLHVSRAQSAAETGLSIAQARLANSAGRFLLSNSQVDGTFGWNLWSGNMGGMGNYLVIPPETGRQDLGAPAGLASSIADDHSLDQDVVTDVGVSTVTIGNAISGASSEYMSSYWVYTPAVALEPRVSGSPTPPLAYSVTYAPLANGLDIRVISTGYDFAYSRAGQPITRTIMQDFRLAKRVKHAIISPSRIMIGKNVMVTGNLGARFTGVTNNNGDPLVLRSDFAGIDPTGLDPKLDAFFASMSGSDVDGDNRLRVGHPTESAGIPAGTIDYDGDGQPDDAFADVTGDGYVDEFDIFLKHYDTNGDGRVTLSNALTAGTPAQGQAAEFVTSGGNSIDEDMALLIDSSTPDRNRNGVWGFNDSNSNGRWDAGEVMYDFDSSNNAYRDQVLGFRDGFIDRRDQYAKVNGKLSFKVAQPDWASSQGPISDRLRGPIRPEIGEAPASYSVGDNELPDVNVSIFSTTQTTLQSAADGSSFALQVAQQLGVSTAALVTYVESSPSGSSGPRFLRLDADVDNDSLPDNWATAHYEKMPFNSPNFSDWYYRPVYENMIFKDVQIPSGTNALFNNCTFVGVTWVRCNIDNTHVLWGEYGKLKVNSVASRPVPSNPRTIYGDIAAESSYPAALPASAIPPNQMILMATQPMDKSDLPANQTAFTQGWEDLPDALVINGKRITDTKLVSNNLRFHDCLFVGSIVSDAPQGYTQSRNKMQFTGATRFVKAHPDSPDDPGLNPEAVDQAEIAKSSMMLPNYSVDVGSFNSPPEQDLQLRGAIIAGVLDVRGNANIDGALLLTFSPALGEGPLRDSQGNPIGNPAGFNTTIGYFGPDDGDAESLDPNSLPTVGGVKIVGWDVDGDGLPDAGPDEAQPPGSVAVPFYGYGRINLRFDPNMILPNGIMLPMQIDPMPSSYREGKP